MGKEGSRGMVDPSCLGIGEPEDVEARRVVEKLFYCVCLHMRHARLAKTKQREGVEGGWL